MKKLLFAISVSIFVVLLSCTNEPASTAGTSSSEQKNMAADSMVGVAFRTGDPSKIDSVVASDFVDHTDKGDKNRDSLKAFITMVHDSFSDMKMDMVRQVAKDDYVYTWMKFSGNSNGAMGMPKGPYKMETMEVTKFNNDNKAVEHWAFMEAQSNAKMMEDMMKAMGPMGNKMDASGKMEKK
jgi:predicted SnoaL-like aldol condensation-catalyzing enzyme